MNPEAIKWLEALGDQHGKHFTPIYPFDGSIASLKFDHEACAWCSPARRAGELVVID